jgi:hypothetical protein
MRRLRVLSSHPLLGVPNQIRSEFEGAQAYVDAGFAEWIVSRDAGIETTDRPGAPEVTVTRERPARRRSGVDEVETR